MATDTEFHARRDAAAQEMVDIIFDSTNYMTMLYALARHNHERHLPAILALQQRSAAVLDKIYNGKAEV